MSALRIAVIGASTTEAGTLVGPGVVQHVGTAPTAFYFGELDASFAQRAQVSRSEPEASEDHQVGERSPSGDA